ncbi:MAG: YdcF family protein [Ktedonobacteraceae bacterium]
MIVVLISLLFVTVVIGILWTALALDGKRFALRDRLQKADAIVVLAGTRGNMRFLQGKISTAVRLYQERWASIIICTGKFSVKVSETPTLIAVEALQEAVVAGRIQEKDLSPAAKSWDTGLGACYMQEQAISMGVPQQAILIEPEALHTRENAEYVLRLLKQHQMGSIILVTSPFHQQRTYLTFAKVFQPYGIQIINYYAEADEWHPLTWFFSAEHRRLVKSEKERIKMYRAKGDLL